MHLLDLPSEVVQRITDRLPLQERLEVHLLCKKFYSMLDIPGYGFDILAGHALALLLFMINNRYEKPGTPTDDDLPSWPVAVEIVTAHPSQTVTVTNMSTGIVCVCVEPNRSLCFLTEESLFRKLAFCGDIVQRVSLKVTKTINVDATAMMHIAQRMAVLLMLLPVKYSGEIKVYTPATEENIVVRKLGFDNRCFYLDSRAPKLTPIYPAMPELSSVLPASTCALSLVMKKDFFTTRW